MVKDHMCIFLDASSTAYTLGMKLTGFTELTVITNGIDLALALSIYEADLKRMCIKASAKTIALIDHTKFDTSSISSYASIDDLNLVITDSGLSENTKEIYEKAGVDLLIAD